MSSIQTEFLCVRSNICKWWSKSLIYVIAVIVMIYSVWNLSWINSFCSAAGMRISPWIIPFLLGGHAMRTTYGFLTVLLFSTAPFLENDAPFVIVRTGKAAWIKGQLLYIAVASLLLTLFIVCSAWLVILPSMGFAAEWGSVIELLANYPNEILKYGLTDGWGFFSLSVVNTASPLSASLLTIFLMWLNGVFSGVLILSFNVLVKPGIGVVVAGVLLFVSAFSVYLAPIFVGPIMNYFTVYSWSSIIVISPFYSEGPNLFYVVGVQGFLILMLSVFSVISFCRRDIVFRR